MQIAVVSVGMGGGALYGFYLSDGIVRRHKDAEQQRIIDSNLPPRQRVANAPPHVAAVLEKTRDAGCAGASAAGENNNASMGAAALRTTLPIGRK